jgi:methionyl-tRNA formyltransferase
MVLPEQFVYYGTSSFSAHVLRGLCATGWVPKLVITTKAKPAGRGLAISPTPVAVAGRECGCEVLKVATLKSSDVQAQLREHSAPWALLAAFGRIVPPEVIALYPKGIVNIHPSLLPKYRGASPIQYAIMNQEPETGVSLMLLDEQVDHGPVLAQERAPISNKDNTEQLSTKLASIGAQLVLKHVPDYLTGALSPAPQDHNQATFTKLITREHGQADFSLSAQALDAKRRAFTPWPGLWTMWQGKRLKLCDTEPISDISLETGLVKADDKSILIGCAQGALRVLALQLEGKKELPSPDFLRGYQTFTNSRLSS